MISRVSPKLQYSAGDLSLATYFTTDFPCCPNPVSNLIHSLFRKHLLELSGHPQFPWPVLAGCSSLVEYVKAPMTVRRTACFSSSSSISLVAKKWLKCSANSGYSSFLQSSLSYDPDRSLRQLERINLQKF